jgi:glycosyltransferase involved in cell wall biosynthesis
LAVQLPGKGIGSTIEDAVWMPRETGPGVDREVTKHLKELGEGYDIIHAFGYRTAWACAEAFGDDFVWVYSGYEVPPAAPALVERLNLAAIGFCASAFTRNVLSGQGVHSLDLVYPGVGPDVGVRLGRDETRKLLEIADDEFVIGSFSDEGIMDMWPLIEDTTWLLGGTRVVEREDPRIRQVGWFQRPRDLMHACDLWIGPESRKGYTRNVAEAMYEGVPVLIRECQREMIEEDVSGFVFLDDHALPGRIAEIREMALTRQTVGTAGRVRAIERFGAEGAADDVAQRYRDVIEEEL